MTPDDRKPLHQRPLLLQVIAAAVILSLVALVVAVVVSARLVDRSSAEVARRYELNTRIRQLQEVLVTLAEAEASQRGYLLTGRDDYLLPHQDAVAAMPQLLRALDGIPIADARLAQHAGRVSASVGAKLAELQQTIELQRSGSGAHFRLDLGPACAAHPEGKAHVLRDRHVRIERVRLKDHGDAAVGGRHFVHQLATDGKFDYLADARRYRSRNRFRISNYNDG